MSGFMLRVFIFVIFRSLIVIWLGRIVFFYFIEERTEVWEG